MQWVLALGLPVAKTARSQAVSMSTHSRPGSLSALTHISLLGSDNIYKHCTNIYAFHKRFHKSTAFRARDTHLLGLVLPARSSRGAQCCLT